MKKLFFPLLLIGMLSQPILAQVKATVKEEIRTNSKGSNPALVMEFPVTTAEKVKDAWSSFVKDYKGKTEYNKKDKEYFTNNAVIKEMSDNTLDICARIDDKAEKGSEISVWFSFGPTYISQKDNPKQFEVANKIMEKFAKKLSADLLEDQLKEEEKLLKKMEDDLKDLAKDEAKRKKDIEEYKETIKKMEENIKKAEEDVKIKIEEQAKKKGEVDTQKKKVTELENSVKNAKGK